MSHRTLTSLANLEYVSFASGGTAGVAFEGIMRAVEGHFGTEAYQQWRRRLHGVAGTSAGAMFALLFVLDIAPNQRARICEMLHPAEIVSMANLDRCHTTYGVSDRTALSRVIHGILDAGGLSPNATLRDLTRFAQCKVTFVASNVVTKQVEWLNCDTHPHMRVDDAVCASCAIPLLFQPVRVNDRVLLVDGAVTEEIPDCSPRDRTLYVYFESQGNASPHESLIAYLCSVFQTACVSSSNALLTDPTRTALCVALRHAKNFDLSLDPMSVYFEGLYAGYDALTKGRFLYTLRSFCYVYLCNRVDVYLFRNDEEVPPSSLSFRAAPPPTVSTHPGGAR